MNKRMHTDTQIGETNVKKKIYKLKDYACTATGNIMNREHL